MTDDLKVLDILLVWSINCRGGMGLVCMELSLATKQIEGNLVKFELIFCCSSSYWSFA